MKLYWAPRTRSLKILWLLEEAGLPYERVLVDIRAGDQNSQWYRAINPMTKVPAIVDDQGVAVTESGAICAHVAEMPGAAPLAPAIGDPLRGAYLRWMFFAAGCIEAAYTQKFTGLQIPSSQAGWGSFERVVDVLEGAVAAGPYVLGERFSAVDVMIGSDLYHGMSAFRIVPERPAFVAYVERMTARPAFRRAIEIDAAG